MATPELADGISHYQFARYAPQHPALLLDLWAKPLFTFLGMPFAQAGPIGLVVMNALLMAVTAWPLMHLVRAFASWAPWLVGPLLVLSPEYLGTAVAGMTEVLFGALAAWVLGLPMPVPARLLDAVDPARYVVRLNRNASS